MLKQTWLLVCLLAVHADLTAGTCHTSANDCEAFFSAWSACDPCTLIQSRHLNITSMPHYDGFPCPSSLVQHRDCTTSDVCPSTLAPHACPNQFDCGGGHCIDAEFVCNGDNDCSNNRDERHCENSTFYSRAEKECLDLKTVPYRDWLSSGYHLAQDGLVGRVIDNQKYQGLCRQAFDENRKKIYRLPYNVDTFHFTVKSSDDLQAESFNSLKQYTEKKEKEHNKTWTHSWNAHADFLGWSAKASHSSSFTHTDIFKSIYNKMLNKRMTLFRIRSVLIVAEFVIKDRELLLDEYFHDAINRLPNNLNAKSYFDFFDKFGASFLRSGELGGTYEHYYLFDSNALNKTRMTTTGLKECLKESTGASLKGHLWGVKFGAGFSHKSSNCKYANQTTASVFRTSHTATHKLVKILGGTSEAAGRLTGAALTGNGTFQVTKYEAWVKGVTQNPALLRKSVSPICDLILSSKVAHADQKYNACLAALKAYIQPLMESTCRPCKNGGKVIMMDKRCQCACGLGYHGPTCAENEVGTANGHVKSGAAANPDSRHNIKLLTSGNPPVASDPPYMQIRHLRERDDSVMKSRADRIFVLSSSSPYSVIGGQRSGSYDIEEFDEFLHSLVVIEVNFTSIDECYNLGQGFCFVKDFDIDHHRMFWLTVVIFKISPKEATHGLKGHGTYHTVIHHMDRTGNVLTDHKIVKPCHPAEERMEYVSYISATCDERLIVTCPYFSTATFKIYSLVGEALDLIQFPNYENVTSVQYYDGNIWFHTMTSRSREVGVYSLDTWEEVYRYSPPFHPADSIYTFTQIFIDFANNLIVGQEEQNGFGTANDKFTIVETLINKKAGKANEKSVGNILVIGRLPKWDECGFAAAYRGKLYLQCHVVTHATRQKDAKQTGAGKERAILVFDYLK